MNHKSICTASLTAILTAAGLLAGCAHTENKATQAAPSPAAAASPAPAKAEARVDLAGGLTKTKNHLDKAETELKNKNARGSVDHIGMAQKEMAPLAANAPAAVKAAIEAAGKQVETAKGLVETHDSSAPAALTKAADLVTKAGDLAKSSGEGAKSASTIKAAGNGAKSAEKK